MPLLLLSFTKSFQPDMYGPVMDWPLAQDPGVSMCYDAVLGDPKEDEQFGKLDE